MIRVAFDIGGTFTDFVLHDGATGATHSLKVPTTQRDPSKAVIAGLQQLLQTAGVTGEKVGMVLHATTVATNAILERKGADTGLITTDGFRDLLIIGRQKRYETYDLYIDKPKPLVKPPPYRRGGRAVCPGRHRRDTAGCGIRRPRD